MDKDNSLENETSVSVEDLPKVQDGKWFGNLYGCDGCWWGAKLVPVLRAGQPTGEYAVQNVIVARSPELNRQYGRNKLND